MPNGNIFPTNYLQMLKAIVVVYTIQGRIQDFKLGGAHLEKLRRVEGGAKIFGVFRVKNHDFTPKNHIFPNCGGRRENFGGISCEKSRFYAIFPPPPNFRGGAPGAPPLDPPLQLKPACLIHGNITVWRLSLNPSKVETVTTAVGNSFHRRIVD